MMAYVVNDGRLLALKPSEWFLMLTGVALTGTCWRYFFDPAQKGPPQC